MKNLKIFTENIEDEALKQIEDLLALPPFMDCKVRIMPDVHAGNGCVIGFTADLGDKVIPSIVGVDIGCGMLAILLENIIVDYEKLDLFIRVNIPSGFETYKQKQVDFPLLNKLKCFKELHDVNRLENSLGTLGGGNHFIEIDVDEENNKYLVIHSGSRNLGHQVASYYQKLAIKTLKKPEEFIQEQQRIIKEYKEIGRKKEIANALRELENKYIAIKSKIPDNLCYLEKENKEEYLHDMAICQEYATLNRIIMKDKICAFLNVSNENYFTTVHNYIDLKNNIVRKGAISAQKDEFLLIPINMRDGCILGKGKGNEDWNCSAPHGAGRIMSRGKARATLSLEDYQKTMQGIYTTSINGQTIDEAPFVYKNIDEIVKNIKDNVEIIKIIKPVYNFKASE